MFSAKAVCGIKLCIRANGNRNNRTDLTGAKKLKMLWLGRRGKLQTIVLDQNSDIDSLRILLDSEAGPE